MISRRDIFRVSIGLTLAGRLRGQGVVSPVALEVAVVRRTRYIRGLRPIDFRVLEDGIPQRIAVFAEGPDAPVVVNEDGSTRPLLSGELGDDQQWISSVREDPENSYLLAYYPNPSNRNEGFREIRIEIIPDTARQWRVRHRPGYRPAYR